MSTACASCLTHQHTLTKPRPNLDSRMVAQQPTRPKMNITALMQMMITAGIRVYLSWMKLSKLS